MSESKYRITDLAKEFKTDKNTIIDILKSKNYKVKNMFSAVGEEERAAVKAELGRAAKPVRKESLQSKAPAPQAKAARPAKREARPAAPAPQESAQTPAGEAEKSVLRARTKAPGIVIVRQAPAKTRAESNRPAASGGGADVAVRTRAAETAAAADAAVHVVTARSGPICVRQDAARANSARAARPRPPRRRWRLPVRSTSSCRRRSPSRISRPR